MKIHKTFQGQRYSNIKSKQSGVGTRHWPAATTCLFICIITGSATGASGTGARPAERPATLGSRGSTEFLPPLLILKEKGADAAKAFEKSASAARDAERAVKEDLPEIYHGRAEIREIRKKQEALGRVAEKASQSAASLTGVKGNKHGDLSTIGMAFAINFSVVFGCVLFFGRLRLKYPSIYSGNVGDHDPFQPQNTYWGWISASLHVTTEMANDRMGLDAAMLIEFCNICCKIMTIIGIPMVCIMCPLHRLFGGNGLQYDLSSVAMGNVKMQHPWLYYVHAIVVNLVTIVIVRVIYGAMARFLILRFAWLKHLPSPRCTSVLVEGIPERWRSDAKLKEFFDAIFGDQCVKEAVMVKKPPELSSLHAEQKSAKQGLLKANGEWEKNRQARSVNEREDDLALRPVISGTLGIGPDVDAIKYYEKRLANLHHAVKEARENALQEARTVGGINMSTGFVTFEYRRQSLSCLNTLFSKNREEWVVSTPPPASDVLWNDLKQPEQNKIISTLTGYACATLCVVLFLPAVLLGTNLTELVHVGRFQPLWHSFAPSLSLMLLLAYMPTVFLLIFRSFFTLKADLFAQHKLQIWYFFFMLFFVILVTTIGKSLVATSTKILSRPQLALELMADHMPHATHFYMNFLMLQCGEQAVIILRHTTLLKFLVFRLWHDEGEAKEMAEPEDQDYYGMGARSARFTVNMLIGIIFSTLSPLIALLTLIVFYLCRVFYGYLVVFAEGRKPDLGGVFFVTQLRHLLLGTAIYNLLMIGVLGPSPIGRAGNCLPMLIAMPSLFYTIYCYNHFHNSFVWLDLPFEELIFHQGEMERIDNGKRYIQPEFIDDDGWERLRQSRKMGGLHPVHHQRVLLH